MDPLNLLFLEIEKDILLRAHANLIHSAKIELSELRTILKDAYNILSCLEDGHCHAATIDSWLEKYETRN